jgi:hypothetical protein
MSVNYSIKMKVKDLKLVEKDDKKKKERKLITIKLKGYL